MLRILEVIGSMNAGGAEALIMNLIRNKDDDVQIDILAHTFERALYDDEIEKAGGHIYHVHKYKVHNYFQYTKELNAFFRKHEGEWDVVHGHISSCAQIYLKVAKKYGFVTMLHSHNTFHDRGLRAFYLRQAYKKAEHYADYYLTCGRQAGIDRFGKEIGEEAPVLINGVSSTKFAFSIEKRKQLRKKYGIPENATVIGTVSRMTNVKNQQFLIQLVSQMKSHNKEIYLMIVGWGPLENELKRLVKDLDIESSVAFCGGIVMNDDEYYSAFDGFALSSKYEGFPVTLIEALFNGLPCLLSKNISPETKINENVVFLPIQPQDEALKEWESWLINHKLARNFDEKRMNQYEAKETFKQYRQHINAAISKAKS
jgi:Glycosyltransferase